MIQETKIQVTPKEQLQNLFDLSKTNKQNLKKNPKLCKKVSKFQKVGFLSYTFQITDSGNNLSMTRFQSKTNFDIVT